MEPTRPRMPLCLRRALLVLSIAAMATVSGASAAQEMTRARPVTTAGAAAPALSRVLAQLTGPASPARGLPPSGSGALLLAGLLGVWTIGHRRLSVLGSRTLDPHGLRRR